MRSVLVLCAVCLLGCGEDRAPSDDEGSGGNGGAGGEGGSLAPLSLSFIDDHNIPSGTDVGGVTLGGLSGLWVDPASGHGWAICDDQEQFGPVRFYELDVQLDATSLSMTPAFHRTFETGATPTSEMDAEGIARHPGTGDLFISTEGDTTPIVAPAILRIDATGTLLEELPVDAKYVPNALQSQGVRRNQGFEALSLAPSQNFLFTATEQALAQDGEPPSFEAGARCRILRVDLLGASPPTEYVYETEPVPPAAAGTLGEASMGVPEVLALSDTTLLVLERASVEVDGNYTNTIRLFEVSLDGAVDVAGFVALPMDAEPLKKRLVLDLDTVLGSLDPAYPTLDNFEAMSFGPTLSDGRSTLLLLSDDNFNSTQRTAMFAFAIQR